MRNASYCGKIELELVSRIAFCNWWPLDSINFHTDNVDDEVEKSLRKERETILRSIAILQKLEVETAEQIRKLRAAIYLLDRDLTNKESSLQIDQQNLVLRENQIDMKIYEGKVDLDP